MYVFFTEKWRKPYKPLFPTVLQFCMLVLYTHPVGSVSQIHFYFGPSLALVFFVFLVFWDIENNVLKIYFHLR